MQINWNGFTKKHNFIRMTQQIRRFKKEIQKIEHIAGIVTIKNKTPKYKITIKDVVTKCRREGIESLMDAMNKAERSLKSNKYYSYIYSALDRCNKH